MSDRVVLAATFALALGAWCAPAQAFRTGPLPEHNGSVASGGQTCRACHGNNAGNGSVSIIGAPAAYQPNEVYDLIVRITDPVQRGGGFQLSVEDELGAHVGSLMLSDPANTRFAISTPPAVWVSHNSTGVVNSVAAWAAMGNAAEYRLQWRAPKDDVGEITFWAAGNAINNSMTPAGDIIYLTSVAATFEAGPCPADLDGDGSVGSGDLATMLGSWGGAGAADLDDDGAVGSSDLALLLGAWGPCE